MTAVDTKRRVYRDMDSGLAETVNKKGGFLGAVLVIGYLFVSPLDRPYVKVEAGFFAPGPFKSNTYTMCFNSEITTFSSPLGQMGRRGDLHLSS